MDSEGNHQELNTGEDTTGTGRRSTSNSDTLSILGRLLGRRSLRPAGRTTSRIVDDDDEDDEDEEGIGMFQYGFRGGRKTADGLFPPASEPVEAGVELERKGLFGRVRSLSLLDLCLNELLIMNPFSLDCAITLRLTSALARTIPT